MPRAVRNADRMNQRRVRVLPRSESRRGEYAAKPHLPGLGKTENYRNIFLNFIWFVWCPAQINSLRYNRFARYRDCALVSVYPFSR